MCMTRPTLDETRVVSVLVVYDTQGMCMTRPTLEEQVETLINSSRLSY